MAELKECENFVENILKPQLQSLVEQKNSIQDNINGYNQLILWSSDEKQGRKEGWTHIGNDVFVQYKFDDNIRNDIFVDVGLGFRIPVAFNEIDHVASQRIAILTAKAELVQSKIDAVTMDIEESEALIQEMKNMP